MERYMVGDEYMHMYSEESDDFFCEKGTIYKSKNLAESKMEELSKRQEYLNRDWKFKIWIITTK